MTRAGQTLCKLIATLALVIAVSEAIAAQTFSPAAQRGLTLVRTNCAACHAIDKISESPLKIAPPFRALHVKYPIENLRRPLREGIVANHPTMPVFRFERDQVEDIIAYLKTLEE